MSPLLAAAAALAVAGTAAVEVGAPESDLFAFPSLLDQRGTPIATSTLEQWLDRGRLHVRITHRFADGRRAVERARFVQGRELEQEWWSWEERRGDELLRTFEVDLAAGRARALKRESGGEKRWDEEVEVKRGDTFVGLGVPYAVKHLRDRIVSGEDLALRTVVFLPKPFSVKVKIEHAGRETIRLAGREVDTDKFEVRPDLKGLEKLIDKLKHPAGADVWLHHGTPNMLLRIEYPLAEARDPAVVVETLGTPRVPEGARARRGR